MYRLTVRGNLHRFYPSYNKIQADEHKRNTQHLPHVDKHLVFKIDLTFFYKFDKETEREYQEYASTKKQPFVIFLYSFIEIPNDAENNKVSYCLV